MAKERNVQHNQAKHNQAKHNPANDNTPTPRPASFDAELMKWMPHIQKQARRMETDAAERPDIVSETVLRALDRWQNWRGNSMSTWLSLLMRGVAYEARRTRRSKGMTYTPRKNTVKVGTVEGVSLSTAATQEDAVDLATVVGALSQERRSIVLRAAAGETMTEIGASCGVSKQRVHQFIAEERKRLARMVA